MRFLALVGALVIIAAIGGAVYFFGGYYNVAATDAHSGITKWTLERVRVASIANHAGNTSPPFSLDDPATVQAGARAFADRGCVNCHGAPGVDWGKFSEALRPDPPDLKDVIGVRSPAQMFWVIKNGIKMTAMPGFAIIEVGDQEIWRIVAFVRKLPSVTEADYKSWTATEPAGAAPQGRQ